MPSGSDDFSSLPSDHSSLSGQADSSLAATSSSSWIRASLSSRLSARTVTSSFSAAFSAAMDSRVCSNARTFVSRARARSSAAESVFPPLHAINTTARRVQVATEPSKRRVAVELGPLRNSVEGAFGQVRRITAGRDCCATSDLPGNLGFKSLLPTCVSPSPPYQVRGRLQPSPAGDPCTTGSVRGDPQFHVTLASSAGQVLSESETSERIRVWVRGTGRISASAGGHGRVSNPPLRGLAMAEVGALSEAVFKGLTLA